MKIIRKILLVLIGIIFTSTSIFYAALVMVNATLLKPYQTTEILDESGIYGGVKDEILQQTDKMANTIHFSGMEMVQQQVDVQKLVKETVNDVVTEEWMRDQVAFMEKEIWDYVLGKDKELAPLDLTTLQDSFMKEIKEKISQEEEKNPSLRMLQLSSMVDQLPGKIDLHIDWAKQTGITTQQLDQISLYYQVIDKTMSILLIVMVGAFLVGMLAAGEMKAYVRWIGVNGMLVGMTLMVPFVLSFIIPVQTESIYAEKMVSYLIDKSLLPLFSTGFVIVALSILLLVISKHVKKKETKQRIGY